MISFCAVVVAVVPLTFISILIESNITLRISAFVVPPPTLPKNPYESMLVVNAAIAIFAFFITYPAPSNVP